MQSWWCILLAIGVSIFAYAFTVYDTTGAIDPVLGIAIPPIRFVQNDDDDERSVEDKSRLVARGRVFSIPDLPGDLPGRYRMLAFAGIVHKDTLKWSAGNAVVVQTGDVIDRGDYSCDIYRFLYHLDAQAREHGGRVVMLLGNHEVMNLEGQFYYATPRETARCGGSLSARSLAFGSGGEYGRLIRSFPVATVVHFAHRFAPEAVLFVHAGLSAWALSKLKQDDSDDLIVRLNAHAGSLLAGDDLKVWVNHAIFSEHGPLWTRFFALHENEGKVCDQLMKTLEMVHAQKMVVGHTVQHRSIGVRCSGRLILSDVGFAPFYEGEKIILEHFADGSTQSIQIVEE